MSLPSNLRFTCFFNPTGLLRDFVARRGGGCRGRRLFRDTVGLREVVFGWEIVAAGFVPSYKIVRDEFLRP